MFQGTEKMTSPLHWGTLPPNTYTHKPLKGSQRQHFDINLVFD